MADEPTVAASPVGAVNLTTQVMPDAQPTPTFNAAHSILTAGMNGLELLPKAKALRPDVPVIMITAYGDADTKRQAFDGGAEVLLTKPIDFVALRNEIDMRVERAA
jgi:CheY-like chemotaxis protein